MSRIETNSLKLLRIHYQLNTYILNTYIHIIPNACMEH